MGTFKVHEFGEAKKLKFRTRVSFAIGHGVLIIPFLFVTALVAFYSDGTDLKLSEFMSLFGVYGAIYGLLVGLLLGILTGKRKLLRIWIVSLLGFAVAGAGFGFTL